MKIFFHKKYIWILLFIFLLSFFFIKGGKVYGEESKEHLFNDNLLIRLKGSSKIYKVPAYGEVEERKKIVSQMEEVDWVEPDYIYHLSGFIPQDSYYLEQWYLEKIDAPTAWDVGGYGLDTIVVAVIDTGVDISHPDLSENIWLNSEEALNNKDDDGNGYIDDLNGWDFIENSPDPKPKIEGQYSEEAIHHGTLIAGIIAAQGNNKEGIIGVSPKVKIMPLRVLNSQGDGSTSDVIKAINYAVDKGAKVINLSFVGPGKSVFLEEAIKSAWDKGVVVVAAAGNEEGSSGGRNLNFRPVYPICYDADSSENFIIGVGATDKLDKKADFSDYGYKCVDISAPGVGFFGTLFYDEANQKFQKRYGGYWAGTSLATPIISGTAALVFSQNPLFKPEDVRDIILDTADNIDILNPEFIGQIGKGRVNVGRAVVYSRTVIAERSVSYYLVTGAGQGGGPHIRVFDLQTKKPVSGFFAYDKNFKGGVDVATGDVNGDGKEEIITGAGPGGGPHVRVFDMYGHSFPHFFVYDKEFRGGLNIAVGDVDGDGTDEIIVGLKQGPPYVFVYDCLGREESRFFAYDKNFKGGVDVATGDVNGDGKEEIITGAGPGGGPHVRVFDSKGNLLFQFFAFNKDFRGGIKVSAENIFGDNRDEIIVGIASNAASYIRVFDSEFLRLGLQFLAYLPDFYQGIEITSRDINNDKQAEIIVGPAKGMAPKVRVFSNQGNPTAEITAYDERFFGGVNVAVLKKKSD